MTPTTADAPVRPRACTHDTLRRLMRRLSQHYDARLRPLGLKTTQYSLLARTAWLGPVRPVDLAEAMGLEASTLTRNLKPLVQAGWVALGPGADARSRLVSLTEAGRAKLAEARGPWREAQSALADLLGTERVAALHTLVDESLALLPHEPHEPTEQPDRSHR
ncbi:MarR family winged helix-turn-helix transcriptional regulator [Ideonella sp.]|uniref:MarR family winged helix-turn-helix transcriptional regulator n=1 Tax=Ideonella sp. TaxID=1929293 RepID=UPI002B465A62|nr:MarR family winged helix-turn-helix transcriptional regulator [Ideonella sp.]HJV70630.1 MarR family winged helix-turn-helix transcriptional regulator [Ideonella sp.]